MKRSFRTLFLLALSLLFLTVTALADMGPTSRLTVKVKNAPQELYYLDLLSMEGAPRHPSLTEEELAVYKRGRNANVHAMPRSATPAQYHAATGLECLMGWLYLRGDKERAEQLFHAMMEEE